MQVINTILYGYKMSSNTLHNPVSLPQMSEVRLSIYEIAGNS